jgi:hypothetical protein
MKSDSPAPTMNQKKPLKQYIGSKKCAKCHEGYYNGWKTTLHSKMEQEVISTGFDQTVLGDFSSKDSDLTFTLDEVDMLVGSRFKQRYAKKMGDDYYMVCFQCHMRGKPHKGQFETYAWAVGYTPGDDLKKYWSYSKPSSENNYGFWADGYAHRNRVQGNNFIQSKMYRKGLSCFTCHDPHGSRHTSFTVKSAVANPVQQNHISNPIDSGSKSFIINNPCSYRLWKET